MQDTGPNGAPKKPFLTAKEAAAIIGICPNILYAWARSKNKSRRPPTRRFGRVVRFPTDKFIRWAYGDTADNSKGE